MPSFTVITYAISLPNCVVTLLSKLEKVSIGHGCPRQNVIQKKVTYVIVTGTA